MRRKHMRPLHDADRTASWPLRWDQIDNLLGWVARFRRLARDYERLDTTLAGLRFLALACLMLHRFTVLI
jgi:hypothetical protein